MEPQHLWFSDGDRGVCGGSFRSHGVWAASNCVQMETQLEGKGKNDKELYELEL